MHFLFFLLCGSWHFLSLKYSDMLAQIPDTSVSAAYSFSDICSYLQFAVAAAAPIFAGYLTGLVQPRTMLVFALLSGSLSALLFLFTFVPTMVLSAVFAGVAYSMCASYAILVCLGCRWCHCCFIPY